MLLLLEYCFVISKLIVLETTKAMPNDKICSSLPQIKVSNGALTLAESRDIYTLIVRVIFLFD